MKSQAERSVRRAGPHGVDWAGAPGSRFAHRPGELLLHRADRSAALDDELRRYGAAEAPSAPDQPLLRFTLPPGTDVSWVVARMLDTAGGARVAPHYVFGAEPGGSPGPARPAVGSLPPLAAPAGLLVGVVDTGLVLRDGEPHPYLAGHATGDADDRHADDSHADDREPGARLDVPAGHGAAVAGRILEQAPGATARVLRAGERGPADDLAVAATLRELAAGGVTLIQLSFGGTVAGPAYPPAVGAELENLPPEVVVVAPAGNGGTRLPCWPAAYKQVIAVGAVDETGTGPPVRASWSNAGWWVDACAGGVDVLGPDGGTGWARWSGTALAAATVTGRIARLALEEDLPVRHAADLVVRDPDLRRIAGLGTYVH